MRHRHGLLRSRILRSCQPSERQDADRDRPRKLHASQRLANSKSRVANEPSDLDERAALGGGTRFDPHPQLPPGPGAMATRLGERETTASSSAESGRSCPSESAAIAITSPVAPSADRDWSNRACDVNVEVAGAHGTTGGGGTVHTTPVTTTALNRATRHHFVVDRHRSVGEGDAACGSNARCHPRGTGVQPEHRGTHMRATVSLPVMKLTSAVTSKSETVSRPSPPNEAAADTSVAW